MSVISLDEVTAGQVKPGDTVLIRGTVVRALPGVGVEVELFSKTDQYTAMVRLDHVVGLDNPAVPAEPDNGTWLVGPNDDVISGGVNVFHRDDAGAPVEPDRRYPRRWQVAGIGEWVDWPTVVARGGRPDQQLHDNGPGFGPGFNPALNDLTGPVLDYLSHAKPDARTVGYIGRTMRQLGHQVTDDQTQQVIDWLIARGRVDLMPARRDQANPRRRYQLVTHTH